MQQRTQAQSVKYVSAGLRIHTFIVKLVQSLMYPILVIARLALVRNKLYRADTKAYLDPLNSGNTYLLFANHQSRLDPFIICACLPLKVIRQLLPYRFVVANSYFRRAPMRSFIYAVGGFPAHYEPDRPYGIDQAKAALAANQTVMIFPSGKRTREHIAKSGVAVLAAEPNIVLVPISIDWKSRWQCQVFIGKPFEARRDHTAQKLMEMVYELNSSESSKVRN